MRLVGDQFRTRQEELMATRRMIEFETTPMKAPKR